MSHKFAHVSTWEGRIKVQHITLQDCSSKILLKEFSVFFLAYFPIWIHPGNSKLFQWWIVKRNPVCSGHLVRVALLAHQLVETEHNSPEVTEDG